MDVPGFEEGGRQTGRLLSRWTEEMRTGRSGPKGDVQKARRLRHAA
jgi:hypothetical protein